MAGVVACVEVENRMRMRMREWDEGGRRARLEEDVDSKILPRTLSQEILSEYSPKQSIAEQAREMRSAGAWEITVVARAWALAATPLPPHGPHGTGEQGEVR